MMLSGGIFARVRKQCIALTVVVACSFLSSCGSTTKTRELAKRNVEQFHAQLNAEQYAAIYAACDEKFHQASSEADFTKLLDAVHKKLGSAQQSDLQNWRVAWLAGQGATITLAYGTKFSEGSATETFVWHVKDDKASFTATTLIRMI